jgi:hypothetical protein
VVPEFPEDLVSEFSEPADDPDDRLLVMDLDTSLAKYVDDRHRLVDRLRSLSTTDWGRTAEHGEYSHYSVQIMFRHLALHDFFHAYRIEELVLRRDWEPEAGAVEP